MHPADSGKRKLGDGNDTGSESEHRNDDERDEPEYVARKTATRGKGRKPRGGAGVTTRKRKARANGDGGNDPEQDGAKIAKDARISDDNALFSMLRHPGVVVLLIVSFRRDSEPRNSTPVHRRRLS